MEVELHDGRILEFPDGTDPAVIQTTVKKVLGVQPEQPQPAPQQPPSMAGMFGQELLNSLPARAGKGLLSGASRIGDTLLGLTRYADKDRSASLQDWRDQHASGGVEQGFDIAAQVAGTAGAGGVLAKGLTKVAPRAVALADSLRTAGMSAGGKTGAAGLLTRAAGGAAAGGAATAMVGDDPTKGAAIGAALPVALQGLGKAGVAVGSKLRGGAPGKEVVSLAQRAKALGIDVPADRLVDSKPLNALASSLNYVPLSGRAGVEAKMEKQLTRAASRLIGQDSDNMAGALRKASIDLGDKFDATLKGNAVAFDMEFLTDVGDVLTVAEKELGDDAFKAIKSQADELFSKGASGVIDGQAAYNIKRTLDRIGRQNTPTAFHALELKGKLMDALNRSLGPEGAQAFAETRRQYSNMIALEKIAKNGVEGDISVARLANMKNINNPELQEIADIAAQFVKPREHQHGAMQRVVLGGLGAASVDPTLLGVGALAGRGANASLSSEALRKAVLGLPQGPNDLSRLLHHSAPVIGAR